VTARVFLSEEGTEAGAVVAHSLQQDDVLTSAAGALGGLSGAVRKMIGREVGTVVGGLLEVDFGDVLMGAWRKHAALTAAARRTAGAPGSEEIVDLATHRVTSTHRPYLEVFVDDALVATLRLELTLEFVIHALVAVISYGRLVALDAGQCDATARLRFEGQEVMVRKAQVNLPGMLRLGDGISLLLRHNDP
jgi:hypothetical protein